MWHNFLDMMDDLFAAPEVMRLPLHGAELLYFPSLALGAPPEEIARQLQREVEWHAEEVVIFGRKVLQPRLTSWHGDADATYRYSGLQLNPKPWTEHLLGLKHVVEMVSGHSFNSVLLNYYRDHRDSMGFHSDDEPELGPNPVIASLSLGEERVLVFKHKKDKSIRPYRLPLQPGSLLLMKGDTQRNWVHGIEKLARTCGPRVNLTFRQIGTRCTESA